MNTNVGMNWQAVLWLAMSAITAMESGTERTVLLSIGMVVMAVVAWRTTGSGLNKSESKEILDMSKSLEDVLGDARED